jgi:hypothetical protein
MFQFENKFYIAVLLEVSALLFEAVTYNLMLTCSILPFLRVVATLFSPTEIYDPGYRKFSRDRYESITGVFSIYRTNITQQP